MEKTVNYFRGRQAIVLQYKRMSIPVYMEYYDSIGILILFPIIIVHR